MAKKTVGPREQQLREMREARATTKRQPAKRGKKVAVKRGGSRGR